MCMTNDGSLFVVDWVGGHIAVLEVGKMEFKVKGYIETGGREIMDMYYNSYSFDGRRLSMYNTSMACGVLYDLERLGSVDLKDRKHDRTAVRDFMCGSDYDSDDMDDYDGYSRDNNGSDGNSDDDDDDESAITGGRAKKQCALQLASDGYVNFAELKQPKDSKKRPRSSRMMRDLSDPEHKEVRVHALSGGNGRVWLLRWLCPGADAEERRRLCG